LISLHPLPNRPLTFEVSGLFALYRNMRKTGYIGSIVVLMLKNLQDFHIFFGGFTGLQR